MVSFAPAKTRVSLPRGRLLLVVSALCLALSGTARAAAPSPAVEVPAPGAAFEGVPDAMLLDPSTFDEWVEGRQAMLDDKTSRTLPEWTVWTTSGFPGHSGVVFGRSKNPGVRHLHVGFNKDIAVGTVMVNGGGALSVLKSGAPFPGSLNTEAHWQPAQRLAKDGRLTSEPVAFGEYALWVLPPNTRARALRFTHTAKATDEKYEGTLGAVLVTSERFVNRAPYATAATRSNNENAAKLVNGLHEAWGQWENRDKGRAPADNEPVISATNPEWITLTWPAPVKLSGLVTLWSGLGKVEVQSFSGSGNQAPQGGSDQGWKPVATFDGLKHGYPGQLWPNRLNFGREVLTRAVRLRVLSVSADEQHEHIRGTMLEGRRIWMGEIMAIESLGGQPLKPVVTAAAEAPAARPPIAVKFTLDRPGFVTLVVERADGVRVRNLVSEQPFPAGENIAWWDGTDDLGRDIDAARHGVYRIPARFVEPGEYRVRGLVRDAIKPRYEFSVYVAGDPPWDTGNHMGGWLANHSPPSAAVFVPAGQSPTGEPAVFLGAYVTEGPDGLAWVDLDGRKRGGKKWIGGHWTAAPYLARDAGAKAEAGVHVYAASVWETAKKSGKLELRVTALTSSGDRAVIVRTLEDPPSPVEESGVDFKASQFIAGLAVHDGLVAVSLKALDQVLFIEAAGGAVRGQAPVASPRGLAFDERGRLHVLSGERLLRFDAIKDPAGLGAGEVIVGTGLEDPRGLVLDHQGRYYVSDRGGSHQIKIFDEDGEPLGTIGKPGAPKAGPYDPLRLQNPAGIAIDSKDQLWVTENDFLPKRVSVWSLDGRLLKAFYGPGKYGGGGALDPTDKTRFYYGEEHHGAMEFSLDWAKGGFTPTRVYYRPLETDMKLGFRSAGPETVLYHQDRRYFTNAYNSNPASGHGTAFLFLDRDGIARPTAAMGKASDWEVLKEEAFRPRWPEGVNLRSRHPDEVRAFFIWNDLNADARAQPDEVEMARGDASGVTVMDDLAFCIARFNGATVRFAPVSVDAQGGPRYALARAETLASGVKAPASSGGNQALAADDGWTVVTLGIEPFSSYSLSGARNGVAKWSYPNLWPGLHASHEAAMPDHPGQLIGPTRLLGGFMRSKVGPLWAINSNHGCVYLFTADGLFVATVFEDMRRGKRWNMPVAERGMDLSGLTLNDENFWPTIAQGPDGVVYLVDGGRSSLVRLEGLESLRRLPDSMLTISREDLERSRAYLVSAEAARQQAQGSGVLTVVGRRTTPTVDGKLDDWPSMHWVDIDKRGVKAYFNSQSRPYDVTGTVAVADGRLYAAWRTGDAKLLENSGEMPIAPFKTGGALDLMIGANSSADPERAAPVQGDSRLIVTRVAGKLRALLYRAVVPGTADSAKVPFSSPWRTITFDKVEDISRHVELGAADGNYEISVPLELLGLRPAPGAAVKGDIGILRGSDGHTTARIYWTNKATGITADVPSEAMLTPNLWGRWEFQPE